MRSKIIKFSRRAPLIQYVFLIGGCVIPTALLADPATTQPSAKQPAETPPIILAALDRRLERLSKLVDAGENVNTQDYDGTTALLLSAKLGDVRTLRFLIAHGADPNLAQHCYGGRSPLMLTSNVEVAQMLLAAKANIDAMDGRRWTALTYAVIGDNAEMVAFLIKNGADIHVIDRDGESLVQLAEKGKHQAALRILRQVDGKE